MEIVLGIGNSLLERSTFEYYFGDLVQNSIFEKVV